MGTSFKTHLTDAALAQEVSKPCSAGSWENITRKSDCSPTSSTCPPAFLINHSWCWDSGWDTFGFKQDGCSYLPTCWLPALPFKPARVSSVRAEAKHSTRAVSQLS